MKITKKITASFIERDIISEEQREIYEYGFELIFADAINFALILFVSIWFDCLGAGLIYLLCFVSTRIFCGGFHAETHALCRISMLFLFGCFMVLYCALDVTQIHILFTGYVIAWIAILLYAPVIHKNKQLSYQYCRKNRRRALFVCGIWTVVSAALILAGNQFGVAIAVAIWIVSASIIWGKAKSDWKGGKAYEWFGSDSVKDG